MFMDKVKNFSDHSMILWEMAGDLMTDGLPQPPSPPGAFWASTISRLNFCTFIKHCALPFFLACIEKWDDNSGNSDKQSWDAKSNTRSRQKAVACCWRTNISIDTRTRSGQKVVAWCWTTNISMDTRTTTESKKGGYK